MTDERRVAAGGWRRGVVGTLVGSLLGLVVSRLVARDDPTPTEPSPNAGPDAP